MFSEACDKEKYHPPKMFAVNCTLPCSLPGLQFAILFSGIFLGIAHFIKQYLPNYFAEFGGYVAQVG